MLKTSLKSVILKKLWPKNCYSPSIKKGDKMKVKYIIFMVGFLLSTQQLYAQTSDRQSRKEAKKERQEKKQRMTADMMENLSFVLEANYIDNNRGNRFIVNPTLNFLKVDKDMVTIQIGNNRGIGHNGVGGITAVGRISSFDLGKRKNNGYTLNLNVLTSIGHYDITMHVGPNGNASATLSGIRPGRITYSGDIVSLEASRVYKGRSI
jgi:hypothetical protein